MAFQADFTPKPMSNRDKNAPVIDMNFNLLSQVMRSISDRIAALAAQSGATSGGVGFIRINHDQLVAQALADYHIDGYGMAALGHMHKMTIDKDLIIPSDWCNQMVNPVVEVGIIVTVEAGGLWFVDT